MSAQEMFNEESLSYADRLARVIGFNATCELCARFGGRTLYIPVVPAEDHILSLILGHPQALKLGREVGGVTIELPTLKEVDHKRRIDLICRKIAAGESDRDLLLTTDVTRKELEYIKRTYKQMINAYVALHDKQMSFIKASTRKRSKKHVS